MQHIRTVSALLAVLSLLTPSLAIVIAVTPSVALAQTSDTMLTLMPHCTETNRSLCEQFDVIDASHLTTKKLAVGDLLDLDIVLSTASPSNIETVRTWLKYDPAVLEARSIELTEAVPSPFPGERDIEKSLGLVKIGGSVNGKVTGADTTLARVTFRVLATTSNTEVSFNGYTANGQGQTYVNGKDTPGGPSDEGLLPAAPCFDAILGCGDTTVPLLGGEPSKLTVVLNDGSSVIPTANAQGTSSSSTSSTSSALSSSVAISSSVSSQSSVTLQSSVSTTGMGSAFDLLQVQNVQVTTRNQDVFLGWQELKSSELKGYNVYYGTVSGRYIQRKSLPASATSLVLRDLEPNTTYFLAIRAFNMADAESAFSQEVSVTVGKPETSTSPLTTIVSDTTAPDNPVETKGGTTITGETGTGDTLLLLVLISAAIGTAFAFHRQLLLHRHVA